MSTAETMQPSAISLSATVPAYDLPASSLSWRESSGPSKPAELTYIKIR